MEDFLSEIRKIRNGYLGRMKLLFLLDAVSIFGVLYALILIFNMEYFMDRSFPDANMKFILPIAAFIIGFTIAFLFHRKDSRVDLILMIEKKYPDLNEKLRTAYDNRDETNVIVDSLKEAVQPALVKFSAISASRLVPFGIIAAKLALAGILVSSTAIVYTYPEYRLPPEAVSSTLANFSRAIAGIAGVPGDNQSPLIPDGISDEEGGGEIFGKPKIASIEGRNIEVTIYQGSSTGFEVRDASQTRNQFIKSTFPVDMNVVGSNVSDGGYNFLMSKTETEKELIYRYAVERDNITK